MLKTLMTHENPLPWRVRWIEKMTSFNFTIYYKPEVKIDHIDFTSKMKTFLLKNNTNDYISTLRKQELLNYT